MKKANDNKQTKIYPANKSLSLLSVAFFPVPCGGHGCAESGVGSRCLAGKGGINKRVRAFLGVVFFFFFFKSFVLNPAAGMH